MRYDESLSWDQLQAAPAAQGFRHLTPGEAFFALLQHADRIAAVSGFHYALGRLSLEANPMALWIHGRLARIGTMPADRSTTLKIDAAPRFSTWPASQQGHEWNYLVAAVDDAQGIKP